MEIWNGKFGSITNMEFMEVLMVDPLFKALCLLAQVQCPLQIKVIEEEKVERLMGLMKPLEHYTYFFLLLPLSNPLIYSFLFGPIQMGMDPLTWSSQHPKKFTFFTMSKFHFALDQLTRIKNLVVVEVSMTCAMEIPTLASVL